MSATLAKLQGANIADLDKVMGASVSTLAKIMGVDLAAGKNVYLGGDFITVRGALNTRNYAAAVDADVSQDDDGMLRAWNPNCGGIVQTMVLNGSDMYLGGNFTTVRGTARSRAACVNSDVTLDHNDMLRAWNPNCGGIVYAMVLNGSDMYLGGAFTTVRGTARSRAACVNSDVTLDHNDMLRAWNPNCGSNVFAMVLSGSDMYLGGAFTTVRGTTRNYAAAVDSDVTEANPTLRNWNPNCGNFVFAMVLNGSDMYLGGNLTTVRGTTRNYAAAVDADVTEANPTLRNWNPNCSASVRTMVLSGSDMYLGGLFTEVRGTTRNYAACVDSDVTVADPTLRNWNPDCSSIVYSMALTP